MDSASQNQILLDQQRLQFRRQLFGTVMLGVMAAGLAFVGQSALAQARPLLDQSFGSWQSFYKFVLWALAFAWLAALVQQSMRYMDASERFESQRRLDEQYAQRAQQRREAEEERERQQAQSNARQQAEALRPKRIDKGARSNKFDY